MTTKIYFLCFDLLRYEMTVFIIYLVSANQIAPFDIYITGYFCNIKKYIKNLPHLVYGNQWWNLRDGFCADSAPSPHHPHHPPMAYIPERSTTKPSIEEIKQ